jgi:hypothetical protein
MGFAENFKYRPITYWRIENVVPLECDGQLAARGPDPARGVIHSGPRQVTGLVRLVKVPISA